MSILPPPIVNGNNPIVPPPPPVLLPAFLDCLSPTFVDVNNDLKAQIEQIDIEINTDIIRKRRKNNLKFKAVLLEIGKQEYRGEVHLAHSSKKKANAKGYFSHENEKKWFKIYPLTKKDADGNTHIMQVCNIAFKVTGSFVHNNMLGSSFEGTYTNRDNNDKITDIFMEVQLGKKRRKRRKKKKPLLDFFTKEKDKIKMNTTLPGLEKGFGFVGVNSYLFKDLNRTILIDSNESDLRKEVLAMEETINEYFGSRKNNKELQVDIESVKYHWKQRFIAYGAIKPFTTEKCNDYYIICNFKEEEQPIKMIVIPKDLSATKEKLKRKPVIVTLEFLGYSRTFELDGKFKRTRRPKAQDEQRRAYSVLTAEKVDGSGNSVLKISVTELISGQKRERNNDTDTLEFSGVKKKRKLD